MTDQTVTPRRGCFFYGCVISLVLLLLLAIAGLVAVHYAKKALTGVINNYTETQAMALPAVRTLAAAGQSSARIRISLRIGLL